MKKASITFTVEPRAEMLEKFQPIHLLASKDRETSQILIFISSCKKSCYIQEKGIWQELSISYSLLGPQKETYYFQVKSLYDYLEIDHDDAYLALVDSEPKIFFKNLGLSKEILQELALPNLEQLNTAAIAKTKLDAEKILKFRRQITSMNAEIIRFEKILSILIDARPALKSLDNDKNEKFTIIDLDDEIKLFKRQKHYSEYVKLIAQIKIQAKLTIDEKRAQKDYVRTSLELNLQKKEVTRTLQDQQRAVDKLKKVAECLIDLNSSTSDIFVIDGINAQIKLIKKNRQRNISSLEKIEEKIKVLTKPESSENAKVVNQPIQSLFFNGVIKSNPTHCVETGLKNLTF